jgi:hypothetical protein
MRALLIVGAAAVAVFAGAFAVSHGQRDEPARASGTAPPAEVQPLPTPAAIERPRARAVLVTLGTARALPPLKTPVPTRPSGGSTPESGGTPPSSGGVIIDPGPGDTGGSTTPDNGGGGGDPNPGPVCNPC